MNEPPKTGRWPETAFAVLVLLMAGYAITSTRMGTDEPGGSGWIWQDYFAGVLLVLGIVAGLLTIAR